MHIQYLVFKKSYTTNDKRKRKYTFVGNVKYRIKRETKSRYISMKGTRIPKNKEGKLYEVYTTWYFYTYFNKNVKKSHLI